MSTGQPTYRRRSSYAFLKSYIVILKVFGVIGGLIAAVTAVITMANAGGQNISAILLGGMWLLYATFGMICAFALANFLQLCIDVAGDVRRIADNSERPAG